MLELYACVILFLTIVHGERRDSGQTCAVSDGVCTGETPTFFPMRTRGGDTEDALLAVQAGGQVDVGWVEPGHQRLLECLIIVRNGCP